MKDGYYWARLIEEDAEWEIVWVRRGWVEVIGDESGCEIEYYEFGEKIERKDNE